MCSLKRYLQDETDWRITWGQARCIPKDSEVILLDAHLFFEIKREGDVALADKVFVVHGDRQQLESSFLLGCSDYIKSPLFVEEVHCRIAKFNQENFSFTTNDGVPVTLHTNYLACGKKHTPITPTESRILKILIKHKNSIVAPHSMHCAITNCMGAKTDNEIRVHIYNIRKKLETIPSIQTGKEIISTIPQQGYILQGI